MKICSKEKCYCLLCMFECMSYQLYFYADGFDRSIVSKG